MMQVRSTISLLVRVDAYPAVGSVRPPRQHPAAALTTDSLRGTDPRSVLGELRRAG